MQIQKLTINKDIRFICIDFNGRHKGKFESIWASKKIAEKIFFHDNPRIGNITRSSWQLMETMRSTHYLNFMLK